MNISILSFTTQGLTLGEKIKKLLPVHNITVDISREYGGARSWVEDKFSVADALVFVGSTGIAVRCIASYLQSKVEDPSVIVLDEGGDFVVPLLSGHIGGGNALGKEISAALGNTLVVTTATDVRGVFAVDSWAVSKGYTLANPEKIVLISSALLEDIPVGISTEYAIRGDLPSGITEAPIFPRIAISPFTQREERTLHIVPPTLTLGIGCRKDTSLGAIESLFEKLLEKREMHPKAFGAIQSIHLKKEEQGILDFSEKYKIPFSTFSSGELQKIEGEFTASSFVKRVTGVDNVCERSALAGKTEKKLLVKKTSLQGVTMAVGEEIHYRISME